MVSSGPSRHGTSFSRSCAWVAFCCCNVMNCCWARLGCCCVSASSTSPASGTSTAQNLTPLLQQIAEYRSATLLATIFASASESGSAASTAGVDCSSDGARIRMCCGFGLALPRADFRTGSANPYFDLEAPPPPLAAVSQARLHRLLSGCRPFGHQLPPLLDVLSSSLRVSGSGRADDHHDATYSAVLPSPYPMEWSLWRLCGCCKRPRGVCCRRLIACHGPASLRAGRTGAWSLWASGPCCSRAA